MLLQSEKLQTCPKDIWMSTNILHSNSDKTEVTGFGPKHLRNRLVHFTLASSATVRNFGIIFKQDMSSKQHVN